MKPMLITETHDEFLGRIAPNDCTNLNANEMDCLDRNLRPPCKACAEYAQGEATYEAHKPGGFWHTDEGRAAAASMPAFQQGEGEFLAPRPDNR